ncbi:hypothetical protein ACWD33_17370 [Streptomyces xiamenensis]
MTAAAPPITGRRRCPVGHPHATCPENAHGTDGFPIERGATG